MTTATRVVSNKEGNGKGGAALTLQEGWDRNDDVEGEGDAVTVFSGMSQQNFAGASLLLLQLLPQKPRQQNLRCASKISDAPTKSLTLMISTCQVKKCIKIMLYISKLGGNVLVLLSQVQSRLWGKPRSTPSHYSYSIPLQEVWCFMYVSHFP